METIEVTRQVALTDWSTWIDEVLFGDGIIYVCIGDTVYPYSAGIHDFEALVSAPSPGRYFNENKARWGARPPRDSSSVRFVQKQESVLPPKQQTSKNVYTVRAVVEFTVTADNVSDVVANVESLDLSVQDIVSVVKNA